MEFRHLRFFIAVAEELSFTRAAERLRVAQPHLSREIQRLERELEVSLFLRDRRRLAVTAAGAAFLDQAYGILARAEEAGRAARRAHRGETGRVRVGFSSSAGFGLLPDAVRAFRQSHADVEVSLREFNSDEQPVLLRNTTLDVSLLYPPRHLEPELAVETLVSDPLVAAFPRDHPLVDRREIALEWLADEPWILFPRAVASRLYDTIMTACDEAGFAPRNVQEGLKLSTISSLVASGLGVALVPVTLARLRSIVCRPLVPPVPQVPLALAWRRDDPNPALARFLQTVREEARRIGAAGGYAAMADFTTG